MADLSNDDVRHLAALARIGLSDEQVNQYQRDLSSILQYVERLNQVDTDRLAPTSQVTGLTNIARADDDDSDTMPTAELLDQSPRTDGPNLKVPKVI